MRIIIKEPATSLQEITIDDIEHNEIPVLKTLLELMNLQKDYWQVNKYYATTCRELTIFDKIRKEEKYKNDL